LSFRKKIPHYPSVWDGTKIIIREKVYKEGTTLYLLYHSMDNHCQTTGDRNGN
jgi:hypothetical protein